MESFQNKLSVSNFKNKVKKENSLGFELVINEIDIEKRMTEFTFKQIMS